MVAQLTLAVVEFEGAGGVDAAGLDLDVAHAGEPALDDVVQTRHALGLLHGRDEHVRQEAAAVFLDDCLLQGFARPNPGEDPALGQAQATGNRLERDRLQPLGRGDVHRRTDDRGTGQFALLGLGVHAAKFSTCVRNIKFCCEGLPSEHRVGVSWQPQYQPGDPHHGN